uniref:ZZ-type domain-containing protein n=1 Tax=Caenorhabditis tropicalis TaxID=1561998 RepID=A0A1I7V0F4_9PELO
MRSRYSRSMSERGYERSNSESTIPKDIHVTFYNNSYQRSKVLFLNKYNAMEKVIEAAHELFPSDRTYRFFSDKILGVTNELINSFQVMDCIQNPHHILPQLSIRLEETAQRFLVPNGHHHHHDAHRHRHHDSSIYRYYEPVSHTHRYHRGSIYGYQEPSDHYEVIPIIRTPSQTSHRHSVRFNERPYSSASSHANFHLYCSNCHLQIVGCRYHCLECPDFDICGKCEKELIHFEHALLRIVSPRVTRIPDYIISNAPDLQVDLNTALVAVKQKCVDLDEKIRRENERQENRGRGYLGVRRYIYALTTKNNENHLQRRGRSLTRVYVEQKFYRSKSVPSADQVQRLEDCTQDYEPNNEERLEYVETIDAPLDELIKEDQSHRHMVLQRLPKGQAEWDHELAVYEEDGVSGRLEDRTLTLRAGDHPFGMNQFNEVAADVSTKIAKFFSEKEENHIRTRELSLSVHPVYHQSNGDAYTSFGMSRSKSMGSVAHEAHQSSQAQQSSHGVSSYSTHHESRPRLDQVSTTTKSLSNLYNLDTRHDYQSRYGQYISGYGHYGNPLPPPKNQEVMPNMPVNRKEEHIYDEPIRRTSEHHHHNDISHTHTTTNNYTSHYERKYDFKSTFPPGVEMPEGYHDYYDPSRFMFLDPKGYYQGNITRPLHYSYSRDYLEKYSDYDGSRLTSPVPPVKTPEPEYISLHRTEDLPKHETHLKFSFPDYYDHSTRIILNRTEDLAHHKFESRQFPDYYDNINRIILSHTKDLDHQDFHVREFPEYYDLATRYTILHRTEDIPHHQILIEQWPEYRPYETQELIETFDDEEPEYEEVYEPVLFQLHYTRDADHSVFTPSVPWTPPPPPPPIIEEIHVAVPVQVIEEIPVPAERHYEEIYIGQEALDVSVSPTFNQNNDQKNLGLEKSVHDRVREMEETMRSEERLRLLEEEKRIRYEERQNEIRAARLLEEQQAYNAYEEIEERKNTPAPLPQPIQVPQVFIPVPEPIPEKPKRTWQPPPKPEVEIDEHTDKPLGPVIFHELIYQQGILRQKFQEEHRSNMARPVSHPVSRANSRPTTPGLEVKSIDFPRLENVSSPRDHSDSSGNVDYVHERIERYNAYGASAVQDSHSENRSHSHVQSNTVNAHYDHSLDHPQNTHHNVHTDSHSHSHSTQNHHSDVHVYDHVHGGQTHRGSVVYDEPHGHAVYDVPHDQSNHHYDSVHHDHHQTHHNEQEIQYQLAKTNQAIRQMSKTNKWEENEINSSKHAHGQSQVSNSQYVRIEGSRTSSSTSMNKTTTHTVLHHSNSLNRQNIPPPLKIENGNSESYHDQHHQHVHFDNIENSENISHNISKSTTSLDYQPVNVGHVKSLAKLFNKHDEKPITTEQVIYRVRAAPPGHHFQQEIKPRPRSMPPVPMDEIELHEHGERDHLTRHQHELGKDVEQHGNSYSIGGGVAVTVNESKTSSTVHHSQHTPIQSPNIYHNSHYHHQTVEEEPTIRVRRVYKALEDTSMLSPISLPTDEPMYDIPTDGFN